MKTHILIYLLCAASICTTIAQPLVMNFQKGHSSVVKTLQLSNDGNYLYSGSRDKTIKMWDVHSGLEIKTLFGHEHTVNNLSMASKDDFLASSSADLTVRVWDIKTSKTVWTSPKSIEYMTAVSLSPDGKYIAIGGYDNKAVVYNKTTGDTLVSFKVDSDKGTGYGVALAWSNDNKWLAIGEDNRLLSLYNTKTWERIHAIKPEQGWCGGCPTMMAFHPNNNQIAKLSDHGNLELIDVVKATVIDTLQKNIDNIRAVEYSTDGKKLLAATEKEIFIYNLSQNNKLITLSPDVKEINDVIFNKDATAVLVGGNDNKITMIDIVTGKVIRQFQGLLHDQDKGGIMYDPNNYWESHIARYIHQKNKQVLSADDAYLFKAKIGTVLRKWEVKTGKAHIEFVGHEKAVISFEISPDQTKLATVGGEGNVIIWDIKTGKIIKTLTGHRAPAFDVRWSHDQTKLISSSWDGQVLVWDIATEKVVSSIYWNNASAYAVTFTKDDLYMIVARLDQKLELYEVATGQFVKTFIGHTKNVNELLLSDNKEEFISLGDDGAAIVWNIYDGMIRKRYQHPSGAIRSALIHKKQLFTAGEDRVIRIWDRQNGQLSQLLEGHQATVSSININKNGTLLISGDLDGITKFWDLSTGKEILEHVIVDKANWMARNPDGYFYATDGAKKYIHYVKDNKVYLLDQFFDEFYSPNLIPATFTDSGTKNRKSIQGVLEKSTLSDVKIAGIVSENQLEAIIHVKVEEYSKSSISELQLFHNGKRLPILLKDFELNKEADNSVVFTTKQALVSGHNRFMVKAINKEKIESAPAEIDLLTENHIPGATCHVLVIGINEYKNPKLNLNYARVDAEAFINQMATQTRGLFSEVKKYELYDQEANKGNILATMDTIISNAAIDDMFVMFFAGHGSMSDDIYYFIPHEATRLYDGDALKKQALSAGELQQQLTKLKALKQIIFIDACQSGGSVELLAHRGASEEKAIAQLSRSAGIHILSAAGSEQYASEFVDLGHGLFTYTLLQALKGDADGSPKDGKVTVYEMKSFIDEMVPELNMRLKGKPQYPYTFSRGNDFPVSLIKAVGQ